MTNPVIPTVFFQVDYTGASADNLVTLEEQLTAGSGSRILKPHFGAYFTDSLSLYAVASDNSNIPLTRGTHYKCVDLFPRTTKETGLEVCGAILITDATQPLKMRLSYQALGGSDNANYLNLAIGSALVKTSGNIINYSDITEKPQAFPPGPHLHDWLDIYGLEYVQAALTEVATGVSLRAELVQTDFQARVEAKIAAAKLILTNMALGLNGNVSQQMPAYHYAENANLLAIIKTFNANIKLAIANYVEYKLLNYNAPVATMLEGLLKEKARVSTGYANIYSLPNKVNDLALWLDFTDVNSMVRINDGTVGQGLAIRSITDKSANARVFTQLTAGKYIYSKLSNVASLAANGVLTGQLTTAQQTLTQSSGPTMVLKPDCTIFVLVYNAADGSNLYLLNNTALSPTAFYKDGLSSHGATKNALRYTDGSTATHISTTDNSSASNSLNLSVLCTSLIVDYCWGAPNPTHYAKGLDTLTSTTGAFQTGMTVNNIGLDKVGETQAGEIVEIIVYNRQLSLREVRAVFKYMSFKATGNYSLSPNVAYVRQNFSAT